jgi:putative ABC transport system permease protein
MFIHNLKQILRSLKNKRLYSFLNISGFAIGFAVVLLITLFIHNEITVDHSFNEHHRIYRLISSEGNNSFIKFEAAQELMYKYPEVEAATPVQYATGYSFTVGCEGNYATLEDLVSTDNRFFTIFNLKLVEGFSSEPFSEKNSAVISQNMAGLLFGETNPLGKTIDIGGFIKVRITGIVQNFPPNSSFFSEIYINIEDEKLRIMQSVDNEVFWNPAYIYLKLKSGNSKALLAEKLSQPGNVLSSHKGNFWLQPLDDIYFDKGIKNNYNRLANTSMIYLFMAIAALILLLSIANHVNFSISLQFSRLRETGIKKFFGAGVYQLANFHLTENLISVLLSFIIATIIVMEVLPLADRLFERSLDILNLTRYPVNLFILTVILAVTILTSIVPLYLVGKFDIQKFMSGLIIKPKGGTINNILSVFQATVSIILIVSFITIYKQLSYAKHADIGFNKENLLRIKLPNNFERGDIVKQELGKLSFVKSSSLSLGVPGMINSRAGSGEEENQFWFNCIEVDEDFLGTFGLNLIAGRNFHEGDEGKSCIINQTAFKKYGWEDIENKKFKNYGLQVVGVMNDFNVSSLHNQIEPAVLIFKNRFKNTLTLRLEPGNVGQQIEQMKDTWNRIMPDYMFDYVFYNDYFNSLYKKEERLSIAVSIFSVLALLITLMGMTGLIFQTCLARSKEIGIRKINGAKVSEIMVILNRDLIKWVVIAYIIAVPVSYFAMQKWLQNFAYRTELNWWIFALAGILAIGISVLTVSFQSWRSATRNPVESLRYE